MHHASGTGGTSTAPSALVGQREHGDARLVRDVMTPDPVDAPDWVSVADFLNRHALAAGHASFPLRTIDGRLAGLLIVDHLWAVPVQRRRTVRVRELAVPVGLVPRCRPDDPLETLLSVLSESVLSDGRALVFDGGALVGIVTPSDVAAPMSRLLFADAA